MIPDAPTAANRCDAVPQRGHYLLPLWRIALGDFLLVSDDENRSVAARLMRVLGAK